MRTRTALAVALVAAVLGIGSVPAGAGATPLPVHLDRSPTAAEWAAGTVACLVQVTGTAPSGEYTTSPMQCWIVAHGDRTTPWTHEASAAAAGVLSSSFSAVGYHFDGLNYTGSYITVSGGVCGGGWLNLSWDWVDRISSTISPCSVKHFDGYNLTGSVETTGTANLSYMDNRTNSIQYV